MSQVAAAAKKIKEWRADPVKFVRDEFHVEPDPWQVDVLRAFPHKNRIGMKACKGPGKTCVESWCAWNFLATRPHPKVVATSISGDNLADGLWTEMAKWQQRSTFLKTAFTWGKTRIVANDHPETWWMSARTWARGADSSQQANTLAGVHADYVLYNLDEVGGIPDAVMAAAEGALASGIETKILMAGNPTHLEGPLYRSCTKERHLWFIVEITSDPDDPKRTPRVSVQWAREQIDKFGRDNPWVLVNVFGKFPPSSLNVLLGPDEVSDAMKRSLHEGDYIFSQKRLGIDVARFGDDRTVLFPRQGLASFKPVEMRGARSHEIAARAMKARATWEQELDFVDGTGGFGAGVVDALILAGRTPIEVNFSGKALDPRYFNKRAEIWFQMAEWVKRGGCLPENGELQRELTVPTYWLDRGKFRLEEKEQIKERLGYSPDMADALALTFALPDCPAKDSPVSRKDAGKLITEFDPLDPDRV